MSGEVFGTLEEAQIALERWRCRHNGAHPHASLGYRPLASKVFVLASPARPAVIVVEIAILEQASPLKVVVGLTSDPLGRDPITAGTDEACRR